MSFIKYILFVIIGLYFVIKFIKIRFINPRHIRNFFSDHLSVAVVGPRRMGKDTLMSWVSSFDKEHNSNIALHPNTNVISFSDIMIPGINRKTLINGYHLNIDRTKYSFLDNNTYISDTALYFPNYEDEQLKKEYPYFSSQLAIWGHLFEGTIHFNIQRFSKLWLQIREHIYTLLECRGCNWFGPYCLIKVRYYESTLDYEEGKTPLIVPLFKGRNPEIAVAKSSRGEIKDYWLLLKRRRIQHDTHVFRKIVFKEEEKRHCRKRGI